MTYTPGEIALAVLICVACVVVADYSLNVAVAWGGR
jgi:hypothetical protein